MSIKKWTLRHLLMLMIAIMGGIYLISTLIVVDLFSNQVIASQKQSIQMLLAQETINLLEKHSELLEVFGLGIQTNLEFKKAFKAKNTEQMVKLLNDEFYQYYIQANVLTVNKIYVFDKHFNQVAESTEGQSNDYSQQLCHNLVNAAKLKKGIEKIKAIEGWCTYSKSSFHSIIVPINTLKPEGYIQVISEPYNILRKLELKLASPIHIETSNHQVAYKSKNWQLAKDDSKNLIVAHQILDTENNSVINIQMAKDNKQISEPFAAFVSKIIFFVVIMTIVALTAFLIVFEKFLMKPIKILIEHLHLIKNKKENLGVNLIPTGSPEIRLITSSFNSLNNQLAELYTSLIDHQNNLEIKIAERTNELSIAKNEAEQANLAKSKFLTSMSHELRTPLNAILGFGQLLDMSDVELSATERSEYIKEILTAGRHLLQLINEVLDLSRIAAGHLNIQLEPIEIGKIIKECTTLIEADLSIRHNVSLIDQMDKSECFIVADPTRFKQVIINLLSNAVKYNHQDGSVTIKAEIVTKGRMRLMVTDTGNGILQADKVKLFDPFERLSFKHGSIEGAGIGLTVTKQLVEAMESTIGVESTPGLGSTFWVEFPLAPIV